MSRREIQDSDREEVAAFIEEHWHSRLVMSRGKKFYPHLEQGFLERQGGRIVGLLTYHVNEEGMEILTLNSTLEGKRIGTSLMLDAIDKARRDGCTRIWLTTTNANLRAIGFYQRLGFRIVQVNPGAVDEARKVKPEIPKVGERGIPIHDEIVMELRLKPYLDETGPPGDRA
ncbi:MAG: GNAT family N-acetyltransferase [Planctomycetota bacterium]|nr:MAG: GNAT family N-acetyltransferase [Planctomycetota bacterium]